jgi:type I restriction enzyme S subunit
MKNLFTERIERSLDGKELHLSMSQKHGLVSDEHFGEKRMLSESYVGGKLCYINDIVLNRLKAHLGVFALAKQYGVVSPDYTVLIPNENLIESCFAEYYLKSNACKESIRIKVRGVVEGFWRLYTDDFYTIEMLLPPRDEQDQIVRYLDWKVSQINRLINLKKRQIALLEEQKRTVINAAVTKGGEGWTLRRLKTLVADINEKGSPKDNFYVGMENIVSWTSEYIDTGVTADGDSKTFSKGDVLFGKLRPYLAKVYLPECAGVCSGEFLVLRGFKGHLPFLKYFLLSYGFIMLVNASTYGAKMPRANWGFIGNCNVPFPSTDEQKIIANYLDKQCANVDNCINKISNRIALLHEYRTRLISDVVTGKLDVRGVEAPQYETVEEAVEDNDVQDDNIELEEAL